MLIDSHAHLTSPQFEGSVEGILERSKQIGIDAIVNICTTLEELEKGIILEKNYPWVRNAAATTPHDVAEEGELYFDAFAAKAQSGALVAIGETGLDYHYHHSPKEVQQHFLRRYLQLAASCKLPVIIHCRDAFADFFHIQKESGEYGSGVLHCFTGTLAEAKEVLDRGWYISLSGIVTFKKSEQLREVARYVPLNRLLIETDAPYLAPQSQRGKTNEPAFLIETALCLAEVKGISFESLARQTAQNAKDFFRLN